LHFARGKTLRDSESSVRYWTAMSDLSSASRRMP